MSQKHVLMMIMSIVGMFTCLVMYDMKVNHRFDNTTGKEKQNWQWKDNWDKKDTPNNDQVEEDKVQPREQVEASSYDEAVAKAGELGKPILIMFEANWCKYCQQMKQTLSDDKVKDLLKNYVLLIVNTDNDSKTTRKFGISGLPSYVITNCDGEKLKTGSGYKGSSAFASWLDDEKLLVQPKKEVTPEEKQEDIRPKRRHRRDAIDFRNN